MAQQQAPPAALAPIAVVVDEVQINSDAMLVLAPGAQHVRDHTSFLNWATVYNGAAAVASYTLGQSDAKGAFLPRCQFSGDQQTGTLLDGNHVLSVFFNGAFWSRLLTALDAANLFATSMEKIGVLHQRLADLVMANPGVWRIAHTDIFLGEDFDAPAVPAVAAGRGRGRGRGGPAVAAVPAMPGPPDLLFLTHLPLHALEVDGELPLLSYSLLSFCLGPTATRAARLPLAAPARIIAGLLQGAIVQSFGTAAANPAMLALQIPRLLKGSSLPVLFQSTASDPYTRLEDFTDMLRMQSGGADERRRIEERRIKLATSLGALYQLVIQPSPSAQTATTLVSRLAAKILTAPQLKLSLADQLAILSAVVHDRRHLVQAGASAEDAVTALMAENLLYDGGRVPGGPAPGADGGPDVSAHALPSRLIEKASMLPKFQALAGAIAGLDTANSEVRRQILAASFASGSDIVFRVVLGPGGREARMNATLAKIAHCKVELPTYLTWCLVVGSGGQRQEELGRYHLTGLDGTENRLFKSFISGNLVGTDYMNGPNGALDWVGSRIRHNFPRVHPKDLYTIRDKVRHLGAFLNKLFVGIGFLEAVPAGEGFTMKTWFEFYIEQLDLTSYYTLYERKCNHLYQCSRQMGAFLRLAEIAVESLKTRSHPGEEGFGALAPEDCQPAKILRGRVKTATWRNAAEQLDEAPIRPVTTCDGDLLPLLSEWENHPWDNRQPGKLPKPNPARRGGPSASCDGRHGGQVAANGAEVTCASGRKRRHEQRRERQRYQGASS